MYSSLSLAMLASVSMTAAAGIAYQDVVVDFDDQPGGLPGVPTDGAFSDHVTFSTDQNHQLLILSGSDFIGGSGPNSLSAVDSAGKIFDGDIYMDFTGPVQNVSFDVLADNDQGTIAMISVAHSGGVSFFDVVGNGDFTDPTFFDFSDLMDVTSIELTGITDEFGLGVDNLAFSVPVPTPSTMALMGLGLMTASRRNR